MVALRRGLVAEHGVEHRGVELVEPGLGFRV